MALLFGQIITTGIALNHRTFNVVNVLVFLPFAGLLAKLVNELMKELRAKHLGRLQKEEVSPYFSLAYTDMLNFYRRMKDHALNIAEVVAGEK